MNRLPIIATPRPRKHVGFLEEYWVRNGTGWQFAGTLGVEIAEHEQATGSENARYFKLEADLEIKRSFSKTTKLKAGTEIKRMVWPLQGREI